ncbi:MAG: helix-turn-helix transcriptional regulator [Lachnospiraceae bacterium]|nr:helix-turn-helix transcriptional regulator [Lachnospiraceae bacterium]
MELCTQIKKFRTEAGMSQDEFADKIYVSRQTVSNWETGKNYPDINSLILMSETFGVSVDTLLKGDAEVIKDIIKKEDQKEFDRLSKLYTVLLLLLLITPIPLERYLKSVGIAIWACIAGVSIAVAFVIEKKKKALNIQTYREIASFLEGKRLDEIETVKEEGKRPYQKIVIVAAFAIIAIAVEAIMFFLVGK